ncbi:MAG: hypothetical protein U1A77_00600 [Pirellulales bacterium]
MSPPDLPLWVWLGYYALAIVCVLAAVWLVVRPRERSRGWMWVRIGLAALLVPLVTQADSLIESSVTEEFRVWVRLGAFSLAVASVLGLFAQDNWFGRYAWWWRWGRSTTMIGLALTASIFLGYRFHHSMSADTAWPTLDRITEATRPPLVVDEMFGVTDLGRRIPLLKFDVQWSDAAEGLPPESLDLIPEGYRARVIVAESDQSPANCHGWVFTGGQYLIKGEYVDAILQDNGYEIITTPSVGDVIIYRDDMGIPIHTGLVKAVGNDGFTLIESKWGALETYYHLPNDQVYSRSYAYYRSPREGHSIHLIMRNPLTPFDPAAELDENAPRPEPPRKPAVNG